MTKEKTYSSEHILNTCKHVALRFTPCYCGISQTEFTWSGLKLFIRSDSVSAEDSLKYLRELTSATLPSVIKDDRKGDSHTAMAIRQT